MISFFGKPTTLAGVCSLFWLAVGTRMLLMGANSASELQSTTHIGIVTLLILVITYLKGWLLFGKMAKENMVRLRNLEEPIPFFKLFPKKTYFFILFFAPTGITLGKFMVDPFYRSMVLLSVGSALFTGGVLYLVFWKRIFGHRSSDEI